MIKRRLAGFISCLVALGLAIMFGMYGLVVGLLQWASANNALLFFTQMMFLGTAAFCLVALLLQYRSPSAVSFASFALLFAVFYLLLKLFARDDFLLGFNPLGWSRFLGQRNDYGAFPGIVMLLPGIVFAVLAFSNAANDNVLSARITGFIGLGTVVITPVILALFYSYGYNGAFSVLLGAATLTHLGEFFLALAGVAAAFSVLYESYEFRPREGGAPEPFRPRGTVPAARPAAPRPAPEKLVLSRNLREHPAPAAAPAPRRVRPAPESRPAPAEAPARPLTMAEARERRARRDAARAVPGSTAAAPAPVRRPAAPAVTLEKKPAVPTVSLEKKPAEPAPAPASPVLTVDAGPRDRTGAPTLDSPAAPLPEATPSPRLELETRHKEYTESPELDAPFESDPEEPMPF